MSEKVLGCIKATGRHAGGGREVLAFTPNRVIVAGFAEGGIFGGGYGGDAIGVAVAVIDFFSWLHAQRKSKELLKADMEEVLKAGKKFTISNSEIRKVELKKIWGYGVTLDIITSKKRYEWYSAFPIVPEERRKSFLYPKDYENILRPVFGDKLSVKK